MKSGSCKLDEKKKAVMDERALNLVGTKQR